MFMRDIREIERMSFPWVHLLLRILGNFSPRQLRIRPNAKDPDYEELVIPERMREFNADISGLADFRSLRKR